jgi:hypothetical protein
MVVQVRAPDIAFETDAKDDASSGAAARSFRA